MDFSKSAIWLIEVIDDLRWKCYSYTTPIRIRLLPDTHLVLIVETLRGAIGVELGANIRVQNPTLNCNLVSDNY